MKNEIRLSTFSIRHELGPMALGFRAPDGEYVRQQVVNEPKSLELHDIPRRSRDGFGITSLELMDQNLEGTSAEDRAALVEALGTEDVSIGLVGLSRCVGDADDAHREEDLQALEELMTISGELGAKQVRVVLLPPPIVPSPTPASFDVNVASLRRLAAHAKVAGVRLTLENDDPITSDPLQLIPLLDAVGPDIGFVLDSGNLEPVMSEVINSFLHGKELGDVVDPEPAYEVFERLLPRAEVVHIKTYGFHADGTSRVYDLNRVLSIVAKSGYDGPLTIEYGGFGSETAEKSIARTAELIRNA